MTNFTKVWPQCTLDNNSKCPEFSMFGLQSFDDFTLKNDSDPSYPGIFSLSEVDFLQAMGIPFLFPFRPQESKPLGEPEMGSPPKLPLHPPLAILSPPPLACLPHPLLILLSTWM